MQKYTYKIRSKIDSFSKYEWNSLVKNGKGSVFHSFEWLNSFEKARPANYTPFYIGVYKDEQLIGCSPFFNTYFCPRLELYKTNLLKDKSLKFDKSLLISHSLYAQYSQIISIRDRRIVIDSILDAVEEISKQEKIYLFGMPMIHESDNLLLSELSNRNYTTNYFNSVCRLYIKWKNFDDYLYSFKNKKRRKIRKLIRDCERKGVYCTNDLRIEKIFELASKTCSHHKSPLFYPIKFLQIITNEMKDEIRIFSAKISNKSIGVLVCFVFENTLTPWLIGLDYDLIKEFNQYNYLYCKIIEYAIDNNIDIIEFGRGTFFIKIKYGCSLEKIFISFKGTTGQEDAFVKKWCGEIERSSIDYLHNSGIGEFFLQSED